MKRIVSPFLAGATFAAGLMLSGMTRPGKVVSFLDFAGGSWDPSLGFVMVGALIVYASLQTRIRARPRPFFESLFQVPSRRDLDVRLVGGALLFGVGWGLAGYCPGPALTGALQSPHTLLFVAAMTAGMWLHSLSQRRTKKPATETPKARTGGTQVARVDG